MGQNRLRFWEQLCKVCGGHFMSARRDAKTCSPKCRKKYSRARGYYDGLMQQELSVARAVADGRRLLSEFEAKRRKGE